MHLIHEENLQNYPELSAFLNAQTIIEQQHRVHDLQGFYEFLPDSTSRTAFNFNPHHPLFLLPFEIAAMLGRVDLMQLLLALNENIIQNPGLNALRWAAFNGHLHVVRYLFEFETIANGNIERKTQALGEAAGGGHMDVLNFLLDQPDVRNHLTSSVMISAVRNTQTLSVLRLLHCPEINHLLVDHHVTFWGALRRTAVDEMIFGFLQKDGFFSMVSQMEYHPNSTSHTYLYKFIEKKMAELVLLKRRDENTGPAVVGGFNHEVRIYSHILMFLIKDTTPAKFLFIEHLLLHPYIQNLVTSDVTNSFLQCAFDHHQHDDERRLLQIPLVRQRAIEQDFYGNVEAKNRYLARQDLANATGILVGLLYKQPFIGFLFCEHIGSFILPGYAQDRAFKQQWFFRSQHVAQKLQINHDASNTSPSLASTPLP